MNDPNEPDPWAGTDEERDDEDDHCPVCGRRAFGTGHCMNCDSTDFDDDVSANTDGDIT